MLLFTGYIAGPLTVVEWQVEMKSCSHVALDSGTRMHRHRRWNERPIQCDQGVIALELLPLGVTRYSQSVKEYAISNFDPTNCNYLYPLVQS